MGTEHSQHNRIDPAAGGATSDLSAREELLLRIEGISDPLMATLGVFFLAIVVVDLANIPMTPGEEDALRRAGQLIYGAFVIDFLLRLLIATDRKRYLRGNWLLAVSLILPMLRPLSFARIVPAAHAITASQLIAGANHALRELQGILRGRAFFWLSLMSALVVLIGSGLVFQFDRSHPDTPFHTYGDSLWWGATLVTTINSAADPVSTTGRVIAFLMRVFAMGVFGYLTASVASYFVKQVEPGEQPADDAGGVPDE